MLIRIMKHEWQTINADKAIWLITAIFALMIGYGIYNGVAAMDFQQQAIAAAIDEEQARLTALKQKLTDIKQTNAKTAPNSDPRLPSVVGGSLGLRYATMPPASLAALSVGQRDLYPYYFKVSTRSKQSFSNNDEIENPINLLAGHFDLAFVIIYLYPLFILALSYNIISVEKEQGTLAMVLSQPVSLRALVMGKIFLRALLLILITLALSLSGMLLSGTKLATSGVVLRLGIWCLVVICYGAFWFGLAVAINTLGRSSATNAIALLGAWLLFVIIAPLSVNIAVTSLYPVPSRVELIQALREASSTATARGSQVLAKYYEDHPELVSGQNEPDLNDFATKSYATQEEVERQMQPIIARFDQQLLNQQRLVDRLRFCSPAIIAHQALNDIAGSGLARYQHFLSLVDSFHQQWRAFFAPKIFQKATMTTNDIDLLPHFTFTEESDSLVIERVWEGIIGLLAPLIVISLISMMALKHYSLAN